MTFFHSHSLAFEYRNQSKFYWNVDHFDVLNAACIKLVNLGAKKCASMRISSESSVQAGVGAVMRTSTVAILGKSNLLRQVP